MKKIFLLLIILCLSALAFSELSEVAYKCDAVTTNYMHVMQNNKIIIQDDSSGEITINIGDTIVAKLYQNGTICTVERGSELLDYYDFIYEQGGYFFTYRIKWANAFAQDQSLAVIIDTDASGSTQNVLIYNESFEVLTFNITANVLYRYTDSSGLWFKGGIGANEQLSCFGSLAYKYDHNIFPLQEVTARLYFDNARESSIANINQQGYFIFDSFSLPISSSGASNDVIIKIELDYGQMASATLDVSAYTNTKNINLDNQPPDITGLSFQLLPDIYDNNEGKVTPEIGWYNQPTVCVRLQDSPTDVGSGVKGSFLYSSQIQSFYAGPSDITTISTTEGLGKEIQVQVLDNVHNVSTMSVRVSVDTTPPGIFYVTLEDEQHTSPDKLQAESGWYHNETVSFSWSQPVDVALRVAPYQIKSSVGWTTWSAQVVDSIILNNFQSAKNANKLFVKEGGNTPRTIYVRAIDKAGNIREVNTSVKVDKTPPTINYLTLWAQASIEDGQMRPDTGWYSDGSQVRWMWSASDGGSLPNQPYAYRNEKGLLNVDTSNWTNVSDVVVGTSTCITGNIFTLQARDMAGNLKIATAMVYVSEEATTFNYYNINFLPDTLDRWGQGIIPNAGWYAQTTLDIILTCNYENGPGMSRLYLKTEKDTTYQTKLANNPTFASYEIIPLNAAPIIFTAMFVDKAGWVKSINKYINADIKKPGNFNIYLEKDVDSNGDGVNPEAGWYDDNTINLRWDAPNEECPRTDPYRIRINSNDWKPWQSGLNIEDLAVTENTRNLVELMFADEAGNIATSQVYVTVDTQVPGGSFILRKEPGGPNRGGVSPDAGWYSTNNVYVSFVTVNVTDNFALRTEMFFLRNSFGKPNYDLGFAVSTNLLLYTSEGGNFTNEIFGAVADKAGNILISSVTVNVDISNPSVFIANIIPDVLVNQSGFVAEAGWYSHEDVNVAWENNTDSGGSIADYPFRLRADSTTNWTEFLKQDIRRYNLPALENGNISRNVYIQARDKAGNMVTVNMDIKIDKTAPQIITFQVVQQTPLNDPDLPSGINLPLNNYFSQQTITLNWDIPSENGMLREYPYRLRASKGMTEYTTFNNLLTGDVSVSADGINTINVFLFAIDKAGNSSIATVNIKVDQEPPCVTISYTIPRSFINPYVISSDTLLITLQVSEELLVTPMLSYSQLFIEGLTVNVFLNRVGEVWAGTANLSLLNDGWYKFKAVAFDNAGNKATKISGDSFFVVRTTVPPSATGFKVVNGSTFSEKYTKLDNNDVTFNVDSRISKYFVAEREISDFKPDSFRDYPENNYSYTFEDMKNAKKTLYLWVANSQGIVATQAVTSDIYFDNTPPLLKIQPNEGIASRAGDPYNEVLVPKGIITAKLEISNLLTNEDPTYIERAIVTPSIIVLLPGLYSRITQNLNPVLNPSSSSPSNDKYMTEWLATYNTTVIAVSGTAYFVVSVTDNAYNVATVIAAGGTFNLNIDAATNPKLSLYSLDGRTEYTNRLTINAVISKDSIDTDYDFYKLLDGTTAVPYDSVNTSWPNAANKITVNSYRIDPLTDVDDVVEGKKDVYVWVRKREYLNPGIVFNSIIYDKTKPTVNAYVDVYKDKTNSNLDEEIRVTLFVSELLVTSNPTPSIYLLNQGRTVVVGTSNLVWLKQLSGRMVYITTLNVPGPIKAQNNFINIYASDRAGNILNDYSALRQQMYVMEYRDHVVTSQPYVQQGEKDYLMMSCVVSANDKPIHLKGINIMVVGQYVPSDIDNVSVYLDGDNNGLFEVRKKYDVVKGIGEKDLDASRQLYIPFEQEEIIVSSTVKRFFVAVDMSNGAVKNNRFSFAFATANAFKVDDTEIVDFNSNLLAFKTKEARIVKAISSFVVNNMDNTGISATVNQGATRIMFKKFKVNTDVGTVIWSGINLSYTGGMDRSYLTNISIYKDSDYNELFDKSIDQLISNGWDKFETGKDITTINFKINQAINQDSDLETFFVVADLNFSAPLNTTFSLMIITENDFFIETPNIVAGSSLPVLSQIFNVQRYISLVDITANNNKDEDVYQGDTVLLQKLRLLVDHNNPSLKYIDYVLEGSAIYTDFSSIGLYILSDKILYNNSNFDIGDSVRITASNTWLENNKRLRILFESPLILDSANNLALVVTIDRNAIVDHTFNFTHYFSSSSENSYISFQNARVNTERVITTTRLLIINAYKPTQPKISGNYYCGMVNKLDISYDSYTKQGNDIVKAIYCLGSMPEANDFLPNTEVPIKSPHSYLVEEKLGVRDGITKDNNIYYLTLWTISNIDGSVVDYYSKPAVFEFKTDLSPPHLPGYVPDIVVGDSDLNNISHQVNWGDFEEKESGIARFIIEEKSNYSPSWSVVKYIPVVDPKNVMSADRNALFLKRKTNMSYSYRIKAENLAGLQSDYKQTSSVTTVGTNKILSNVSNYPNPFYSRKETTKVFYYLSQNTGVEMKIFDSLGHFLRKFNYPEGITGKSIKGDCEIEWDGKNEAGQFVEKGGYFVVLEAPQAKGESTKAVRMVGVLH